VLGCLSVCASEVHTHGAYLFYVSHLRLPVCARLLSLRFPFSLVLLAYTVLRLHLPASDDERSNQVAFIAAASKLVKRELNRLKTLRSRWWWWWWW
jgi:hypothetical protein